MKMQSAGNPKSPARAGAPKIPSLSWGPPNLKSVVFVFTLACSAWVVTPALPSFGAGHAQAAEEPARLTYTKVMEGSTPEFEKITVDLNGSGAYDSRKLSSSPHPRP